VPIRDDRRGAQPSRRDPTPTLRVLGLVVLVSVVASLWPAALDALGLTVADHTARTITSIAAAMTAAAAAWWMWRGARQRVGRDRAAWTTLAAATLLWSIASAVWGIGTDPLPFGFDAGETLFVLSYLVGVAGFVALPSSPHRSGRVRLLDVALMALCSLAILWSLPVHNQIQQMEGSPGIWTIDLFAIVEILLVVVALSSLPRCLPDRSGELRALVGAALLMGLSDVVEASAATPGVGPLARAGEGMVVAAATLAVVAARRTLQVDTRATVPRRRAGDAHRHRRLALPELFTIGALVALVVHDRVHQHADWPGLLLGSLIVFLSILRLAQVGEEQEQLTESLRASVDQLHRDARTDALTRLGNRLALDEHLSTALEHRARQAADPTSSLGVFFVDIDLFKRVNDAFGHQVGDGLLVEVARRISGVLGPHVFRTGGDEFVAVLDDCTRDGAVAAATDVIDALGHPLDVDGHELAASVSIGLACSGDVGARPTEDTMLRAADLALYRAKELGRAQWAVYDTALQDRAAHRRRLHQGLERAAARDELRRRYDPVLDLQTGRVVGVTTSAWWDTAEHGLMRPDQVEEVALDGGLVQSVVTSLFDDMARILTLGPDHPAGRLWVGTRLRRDELIHPSVAEALLAIVRRAGDDAGRLHIDVTEETVVDDAALEAVSGLSHLGVSVTVDRFGHGPSSLLRMDHYPAAGIRIDASFVHGLARRRDDTVVVRTIAQLGSDLGLELSADGIDEELQASLLADLGFRTGRGRLFGEALEWDDLVALIERSPAQPSASGAW
jgi:diguanylate cyclase (GGDEF)-like protein